MKSVSTSTACVSRSGDPATKPGRNREVSALRLGSHQLVPLPRRQKMLGAEEQKWQFTCPTRQKARQP